MHRLVRVHQTSHGWGFFTRHQETKLSGQLNISVKGEITTTGFVEFPHLIAVHPDPATTIIKLDDSALWVHMNFLNSVIATRLFEVDGHLHEQALNAVNAAMKVLDRIAIEAGYTRR